MRRTLLALIAALALLLSGCAEEKKEGVATAGEANASASTDADQGDTGDITAQSARFAQCMRDNGVDMPDPEVDSDGRVKMGGPGTGAVDRDKAQAAHEKCKQFLPNGGQPPKLSDEDLDKMRKFSQCMRENGFPDFPDPQPEGGIRIENDGTSDMDPESQKWKDAHATCEKHIPARPGGDTGPRTNTGGGS